MLSDIQQALPHLEHIRLLTRSFIQNTAPGTWQEISNEMNRVSEHFHPRHFENSEWQGEGAELNRSLETYQVLLSQLYSPAIKLHQQKLALQGIGLDFSKGVEDRIVRPFRKEEGLRLFNGQPLDPIKARVKDTAYELVAFFNKQQLILQELLLNSNLDRYRLAFRGGSKKNRRAGPA